MQLMWLSGPTGNVRTISITTRTVLTAAVVVGMFLVASGFLLHFVGFKIAVEYNPDLARSIGGVTTEAEQKRMESVYRDHLSQLRESMHSTVNEIRQLEAMKNRFMEMATPTVVRDKINRKDDNKGGPLVAPRPFSSLFRQPLGVEFDQTLQEFVQTQTAVAELHSRWEKQLEWLSTLPTGVPVQGDFRVSSGFGIRNDPFTGGLAMHEGLDFTASSGTAVVATAKGVVTRSGWDMGYGNVVEVQHAEGFSTRYAHLSKRLVQPGDPVERGGILGEVGSTGRSTGPHLHYEVFNRDRVINPVQVLLIGSN
ncbi:MAG: Murein DD-endopeptidase MepM [Pseudomonadota bacterium]|jgi:murein DD-endopeptidase MepM/ murein hydrolase activator NlpD